MFTKAKFVGKPFKSALILLVLSGLFLSSDFCFAQGYNIEKHIGLKDKDPYKDSNDSIDKRILIDSNLDSSFFKSTEASYKWYILKTDDGTFENTMGEPLTNEDKTPIEHTSNCISTHQGEHAMNFCDASLTSDILRLNIHGGLPAYISTLLVEINKNLEFACFLKQAILHQ